VRLWRSFPSPVLLLAGVVACSSQDSATIALTQGGETTTFTQAPAVTQILIQQVDSSGNTTTLGTAPFSASTIPLTSESESETVSIEATGLDAQDAAVVFGQTIPLYYGSLVGDTVWVFVQRTGAFARAPSPPTDFRQAPLLANVQGQFVFMAGGTLPDGGDLPEGDGGLAFTPVSSTQLYDFGALQTLAAPPTLPSLDGGATFAPQSLAMTGTVAWLISTQGGLYFDLSSNASEQIPEPAGGPSFADIAGGITVADSDGGQYIVGGTRTTGAPSTAVLWINPNDLSNTAYPDGNAVWLTLSEPRLGASATWVPGYGLVVAGGSANGSGVEVLDVTSNSTTNAVMSAPLPFPPDPSVGAGATPLTGAQVLLAGGILPNGQDAGARGIDLSCRTTQCTPTVWTPLPTAIGTAQAFTFSATSAMVIGNEPLTGITHAFQLTAPPGTTAATTSSSDASVTSSDAESEEDAAAVALGTAVEVSLPTYQGTDAAPGVLRNARAIWSPVASIVVFGGYDVLDTFRPPL